MWMWWVVLLEQGADINKTLEDWIPLQIVEER